MDFYFRDLFTLADGLTLCTAKTFISFDEHNPEMINVGCVMRPSDIINFYAKDGNLYSLTMAKLWQENPYIICERQGGAVIVKTILL